MQHPVIRLTASPDVSVASRPAIAYEPAMLFVEVGSFDVLHRHLAWPWIAIDASRRRFAFVSSEGRVATRAFLDGALSEGPSFSLPGDLGLPTEQAPAVGHRGVEAGLHGFAIDGEGTLLALTGTTEGESVVVTVGTEGERMRTRLETLAGAGFVAHAVAFDRAGTRLWVSAESGAETALVLLDARSHALLGVVRSAPFPPPSFHELHVHPQDDAVLLLAACGQDGTFARIAGWSDGPPIAVPTTLDGGSVPAGFVGFSSDGSRVHLVESDALRTHAWPGLVELSSVELADDFVSSYAGAVLGHDIFVDGSDSESEDEDRVMVFERAGIRGSTAKGPVPGGMWVGRLGTDAIVTVSSKGDPARGGLVRIPTPTN